MPKPPGPNRRVRILDRRQLGLSSPDAAWRTVEALVGQAVREHAPLATVPAILDTVAAGIPVVLAGRFPTTSPTPKGYLVPSGARAYMAVAMLTYNVKREAVRVTPSLGLAWGQAGRAWMAVSLVAKLLREGARAWRPIVTATSRPSRAPRRSRVP